MKLYVLDRFEEDYGILTSGGESLKVPVEKLPCGAVCGSVLNLIGGRFYLNIEVHTRRNNRARNFIEKLKNK